MRIVRLSDLHWAFLGPKTKKRLYEQIAYHNPDEIYITGDIAEASTFVRSLIELHGEVKKPINFILGNHDYYNGSFNYSHATASDPKAFSDGIDVQYAHNSIRTIGDSVIFCLNGFADGRAGNFFESPLFKNMSDFRLIGDFIPYRTNRGYCLDIMQEYADAQNTLVKDVLSMGFEHTIIFTHVPPFAEASLCRHGDSSNGHPFYVNVGLGNLILKHKKDGKKVSIYCGHTHMGMTKKITDEITVFVSGSDYGQPYVDTLEVN